MKKSYSKHIFLLVLTFLLFTLNIQVFATDTSTKVKKVTLNQKKYTLNIGDTFTLVPTISPDTATNKSVTWTSSKPGVATVDSNGIVTGVSAGKATITVKTVDGNKKATCTVTVPPISVTGIALTETEYSMNVGDTYTLSYAIVPSNASNQTATWKSSNKKVATVDSDGNITAKSAGTTSITVTTKDGKKVDTCDITVLSGSSDGTELTAPNADCLEVDYLPGQDHYGNDYWVIASKEMVVPGNWSLYVYYGSEKSADYISSSKQGFVITWNEHSEDMVISQGNYIGAPPAKEGQYIYYRFVKGTSFNGIDVSENPDIPTGTPVSKWVADGQVSK